MGISSTDLRKIETQRIYILLLEIYYRYNQTSFNRSPVILFPRYTVQNLMEEICIVQCPMYFAYPVPLRVRMFSFETYMCR